MTQPMSDLDRLVDRILEARTVGYISLATRKTLRDAEDALRLQDATITRLREALEQIRNGSDAWYGQRRFAEDTDADFLFRVLGAVRRIARQALGGEHA